MKDRLDNQINDSRELLRRLPTAPIGVIGQMILAAAIERAADQIAHSVDNLELIIRTKKPEGL